MARKGAIAPMVKMLWGQGAPQKFCYVSYESVIIQVTKGALISSLKMHEERLADPLRELTALLQTPYITGFKR